MTEGKQRHGCLAVLLVVGIFLNLMGALTHLVAWHTTGHYSTGSPSWAVLLIRYLNAGHIMYLPSWAFLLAYYFNVCYILFLMGLFSWKKWGFFGLAATALSASLVNFATHGNFAFAVAGLVGTAAVWVSLHIGVKNNGWTQLE